MSPTTEPPWTHHLTLDTLILILSRSLFHPFITLLIPLSLRACAKPYDSPSMILSFIWSAAVITCHLLSALNTRLAYGPARELDWEEEVVVITGGRSGLGKVLAEMYGMRGASVAVLDLSVPAEGEVEGSEALAGVKWYACDVSKLDEVHRAREAIEEDLGTPTILINNAAAPISAKPLLSLTAEEYTRTLNVNLLSHFHTLSAFLPGMLESEVGGTIVTISSVLGKLGAANLTPYTASKAGLLALHTSLTAELRQRQSNSPSSNPSPNNNTAPVRTVLVTPGHLSTTLFPSLNLPAYAHFLGPVVSPVELAKAIVARVDSGMGGEISLPVYAGWVEWLFVLPGAVQKLVRWVAGVDGALVGSGRKDVGQEGKKEK